MNIPNQFPIFLPNNCNVVIQAYNGEVEDGHEKIITEYNGPAYFSSSSKRVQDKDGIWISLAGIVLLGQDICPDEIALHGKIKVNNSIFYNFNAHKTFNPDGTFHHLKIEVGV